MEKIKLDTRLSCVASLIRKNTTLLDIGTDHAYLPVYCLQNGICIKAIASDINEGPLNNAKKTIENASLQDKIETILSAGLQNIKENSADEIVIAGMGGILISEIIAEAEWLKNKDIHIIAQPMTHAEKVREYFINNGFEIVEEKACSDSRHNYCVISARFTNAEYTREKGYIYYGELANNNDVESQNYLKKVCKSLKKKHDALKQSGKSAEEVAYLSEVLNDFEKNTGVNYDNC